MKKLVKIYYTYGKGSGEELDVQFAIDDNKENREEIFEVLNTSEIYEDEKENFINGKKDSITWDICDDWDSPTGCTVVITSYREEKNKIEKMYNNQIEKLNELFGE